MHPTTLRARLTAVGVPNITGALQPCVDFPAGTRPVVAGCSATAPRSEQIAAASRATWKNYASEAHGR